MINEWCTIESDPGVFTELIRELGVKDVVVEEVYSMDDQDLINRLKPIHGLIFLFKWQKSPEKRPHLEYYDNDLFFANQVIPNACATQAILSVLLNAKDLELGEELNTFKSFTKEMDSKTKGAMFNEAEKIRTVHNSFARAEPFIVSHEKQKGKGEAFHFVAYVPVKGKLYELDGLQAGPIALGECTDENWLELAKVEINERIKKYAENEIRFTLLALSANKKEISAREVEKLTNIRAHLYKALIDHHSAGLDAQLVAEANEHVKEIKGAVDASQIPQAKDQILGRIQEVNGDLGNHQAIIQDETAKFKKYEIENIRRKHNYLPFILEMLKLTAKKGKLKELVDTAKEKFQAKQKAKEDKKAEKK
jgi:ubiquitin carboxyl-terminal hydrolase L5